ncbi:MAG TPA: hypothetical protein VMA73_15200 [Streptosporangiaceae bacterium]|nr:hypothetical protein [Streptosporangiaceae bacterium]
MRPEQIPGVSPELAASIIAQSVGGSQRKSGVSHADPAEVTDRKVAGTTKPR